MKGLTPRQHEVLSYIEDYSRNKGYAPSFREIQSQFSFSSLGSVYNFVKVLKTKGKLENTKNSRICTLQKAPVETGEIELPLIGHLSAGFPIEIFARPQTVNVPQSLVHSKENTYVLRVQGETLVEEHIADGDLLIVEARPDAHPGETVIALINGHDTIVKRYFPEGDEVRLEASHPHHAPLILHQEDIIIQGTIIGLIRMY